MMRMVPLQSGEVGAALVIWLIFTTVLVAAVYWVYKDAQRNSEHPAFLWAIVVFVAPLLGLLLYFILGRDIGSGGGSHRSSKI